MTNKKLLGPLCLAASLILFLLAVSTPAGGVASKALQSGVMMILGPSGPTPLQGSGTGALYSNGFTSFSHISTSPATAQAVSITPAALVTNGGTPLSGRIGTMVSNYGNTDAWISSTNATVHGQIIPAGNTTFVTFAPGTVTLYIWSSGSTNYDATEVAY